MSKVGLDTKKILGTSHNVEHYVVLYDLYVLCISILPANLLKT